MTVAASSSRGYRDLAANRNFVVLAAGMLLGRTASNMWRIALVLILIVDQHSPSMAGLALFVGLVPGLLLGPVAGSLLDRRARRMLVMIDYAVAGGAVVIIAALLTTHLLQTWELLVLVAVSGVTSPLSATGLRTLLPAFLPRHQWDRGNAIDASTFGMASFIGPAVASLLFAALGGSAALIATAVCYGGAAVSVLMLPDPAPPKSSQKSVLHDAARGVAYVFRNRSLRTLGYVFFTGNIGNGVLTVALPVFIVTQMHANAAYVGLALALLSACSIVASIVMASQSTENREWHFMGVGNGGAMLGFVILAASTQLWGPIAACAVIGLFNGPASLAGFSLRQRRTDPAWFGRAFAIHSSLNYIGMPIGSAIAGVVATFSAPFAAAIGVVALAAAALLSLRIPRTAPEAHPSLPPR